LKSGGSPAAIGTGDKSAESESTVDEADFDKL
jgi:phage shock protein A